MAPLISMLSHTRVKIMEQAGKQGARADGTLHFHAFSRMC